MFQPLNNPEIKEDKEGHIKDLIQEGLFTINKYFDKIEVSVSDSEDEETETRFQYCQIYQQYIMFYIFSVIFCNQRICTVKDLYLI